MKGLELSTVIDKAGGHRFIANTFGISTQAVYGWRVCPAKFVVKVARLADVKPEEVRPDMYDLKDVDAAIKARNA